MEEPYVEGLASHHGPGSYADSREAVGGALIGVSTGWVTSLEIYSSWMRRRHRGRRKAISSASIGETGWGTRGLRPPCMCGNTLLESGRPPVSPQSRATWGAEGSRKA